jgi:hypothetical protein
MKQFALLLGKIFIFTTVPVVLAMSACFLISSLLLYVVNFASGNELLVDIGWGYFLPITIRLGLLTGAFMTLILAPIHYFQVRKVAQGKSFDLSPIQQRKLVSKLNPSVVLKHCAFALQQLPARIVESDTGKNYITARTKANCKTWGDVIRIDVAQLDNENTQVKIVCRPSLKMTLVDYGRNYENAEKLLSLISKARITV